MSDTAETSSPAVETPRPPRGFVRRWRRRVGIGLCALIAGALTLWSGLAVYFADTHAGPRTIVAAVLVVAMIGASLLVRPRRWGLATFAALFVGVIGWFFSLTPSNDRDWAPEVSRLPLLHLEDDTLTVRNVRNFDYRSETDFTPAWDERTYDVSTVRTVDLMLVYWGSKAIAHAMVSFEFDDGRHLAVSIETRKERAESYSTVQGFFRQYELFYVFADERDVIRLRTNFRKEDVYLYHTTVTPEHARAVLLSYVRTASALDAEPQFYNALTSNCATNVVDRARDAKLPAQMSWEILLSGYAARQAYRNGRIDTSMPFEELEGRSRVNDAALAAGSSPDFSRLIRAGLPEPAKVADAGRTAPSTTPAATRPAHK